jgi:hypothetical protein
VHWLQGAVYGRIGGALCLLVCSEPNIPGAASTSAFCDRCWRGDQALPVCQIETIVTRLLRRFLPGGSLEPLP